MYRKVLKRMLDFWISLAGLILLSPVLLVLTVTGTVRMKGNPFFTQERPGYRERIFRLIKFRTMTNERDAQGNLLSDAQRLCGYGRFLRASSLDELPELINILKGDMALVGPRPLLPEYLPYYTEEEKHRHDVRPGLTGLAQVNGRNALDWDEKFRYDVDYVDSRSLWLDAKILLMTAVQVLLPRGISHKGSATMPEFTGG